ncbi:MAG: type II toxin-antitoxin system Phd/YefM family antitoxin [Devosia sp.]|nr:type II toxin-antitoxin system Phd/YefM family antitoxin [Devosia sp.]
MNQMLQRIEADLAVGISELKKNPNAVFAAAETQAVAVLNHNRVVAYVISPVAWEGMLERLDDLHIIEMLEKRKGEPGIEVTLDELSGQIRRKRPQGLEQAGSHRPAPVREGAPPSRRESSRAHSKAPRKGQRLQDQAS